jgi:SAM-dependent methyltransferase
MTADHNRVSPFEPEAFDRLYGKLVSSNAVDNWGRAVFDIYIGQVSHTLAAHVDKLISALGIKAGNHVLEVGSGAGGFGCYVAERTGCRLDGLDWSRAGVSLSNLRACNQGLSTRVRFFRSDLRHCALPPRMYDAAFAIDLVYFGIDLKRLAKNIAYTIRGCGAFGMLVTVLTPSEGSNLTCSDTQGVPRLEDVAEAFASAEMVGGVTLDITESYVSLVTRMLDKWETDQLILRSELGNDFVDSRLAEDEYLLRLLHEDKVKRVLYVATALSSGKE